MFQDLAALVAKNPVSMTLTMDGDLMTVVVIPKGDGKADQALSTPLLLTGTPDELDKEFATVIGGYTASRQSLSEQLAAAQEVMNAAAKAATKTAAKANQKAAKKVEDDDADQSDSGDSKVAAPAKTTEKTQPKVEIDPLSNLFNN